MAVHLWLRAEARETERRTPLLPEGAADLIAQGFDVTVEESPRRIAPVAAYAAAGCRIAPQASWPEAPKEAVILGLKELPENETPLRHAHVFFAHAFKGQPGAGALLARFRRGGGTLYDIEYLVDGGGRRVAAFGYWAGYVGAALSILARIAQREDGVLGPVSAWESRAAMLAEIAAGMDRAGGGRPTAMVIGAKGRVGTGAADLLGQDLGLPVTLWDQEQTAHGGPFPEVARHELMLNCVLAGPGVPVLAGPALLDAPRRLRVIGDVACDPGTPYNPVPLYERATDWARPVVRVAHAPPLDIMAIDNLPSLLPAEASREFAGQLLPHLKALHRPDAGVWGRAAGTFARHAAAAQ